MKKFIRFLLIFCILLSTLLTLAVATGSVLLSRYKSCRVDSALLELSEASCKTEFYCFDHESKEKEIASAIKIENASLDNGVKYKYVSYDLLPKELINAFIAIEDKRFYSHQGVDLLRTGKAAVNYVFGTGDFGGSTITQQLVKNLTGHDEFRVERKLSEAFSAIALEKEYHKTEILETYLNVINLAHGCRGVGAAAEYYYDKEPLDLSLSECATIAAITNNPSKYDPQRHPDSNKKRRDLILKCMLEQKMISEPEYLFAVDQPILLNLSSSNSTQVNSWYIDAVTEDVITDLCEQYGISRGAASLMLYRGGFRIYTAMDPVIQAVLDEYYSNVYNFPIDEEGNMPQSSMLISDPYTGDILGIAGAVGMKNGNRLLNYATDVKRPPGSTIKPLSVYAPAIEKGMITWSTVVEDSPVTEAVEGRRPWPSNVTDTYVGNVNVKYAVEHSLNTVAVKILYDLGAEDALRFLQDKLHIASLNGERDIGAAALALGQPTHGVTLREMTAAYSIFQEGIMSKPRTYYLVTDQNGRIILDNAPRQEVVISRETAAIMTKLMETVVDTGTAAGKITLDKTVDVAGKSGTSQSNCDRYFIGYTPELLAGVWFGYDYPKDLSVFGGNVSIYLWDEVMTQIYERTSFGQKQRFSVPDTVQKLSYDPETGLPPSKANGSGRLEEGWFNTHIPE